MCRIISFYRITVRAALISLCAVFLFAGCKQEAPPPLEPQKPVVAPPPPISKVKTEEGEKKAEKETPKRNPFKPFISQEVLKEARVVEPQTPLQRYEIGQLKLVAVVWGIDGSVAMVETPDGKGYSVRKDALIGNRGGKISKVLNNQIVIEEKFKDYTGAVQTNEQFLSLPASTGEGLR